MPLIEMVDGPRGESLKLHPLPEEYASPSRYTKPHIKDVWAPLCSVNVEDLTEFPQIKTGIEEEIKWLEHTNLQNAQHKLLSGWSQHHASCNRTATPPKGTSQHHASCSRTATPPKGTNSILPLLRDPVHTLQMQWHVM